MNCVPFQAHHMRMAQNAAQNANRMQGVPRHNGPQYSMMQPHLQRQVNKGIVDPSFLISHNFLHSLGTLGERSLVYIEKCGQFDSRLLVTLLLELDFKTKGF